jgi:hypothetical protein
MKTAIVLLIATSAVLFYFYVYDGTCNTFSYIDNKYYKVRNTPAKYNKANLLANLKLKLGIIVNSLPTNSQTTNLKNNWNRGISLKETGNMETDAAYVINKQYMSFCLNNSEITIENINLLTYVGIHELSHVMSYEIGHGEEFKTNFKYLLDQAKNLTYHDNLLNQNIPVFIDLHNIKTPDHYCGVSLTNSIS